jgi:hypothetical protein
LVNYAAEANVDQVAHGVVRSGAVVVWADDAVGPGLTAAEAGEIASVLDRASV